MISLFVDVQPDFLEHTHNSKQLQSLVHKEYDLAKKNNSPCIVLETVDPKYKVVTSKSIIGTDEDIKIIKTYSNGFTKTNLFEKLAEYDDKDIFISGVYANACIYFTARQAKEDHGYNLFSKKGLIEGHSNPENFKNKKISRWLENNITYLD